MDEQTIPTIGYDIQRFFMFGKQYAVYDMSGDIQYLDLWEDYYETIQGIIFVIEAKDKRRINMAKELLK